MPLPAYLNVHESKRMHGPDGETLVTITIKRSNGSEAVFHVSIRIPDEPRQGKVGWPYVSVRANGRCSIKELRGKFIKPYRPRQAQAANDAEPATEN